MIKWEDIVERRNELEILEGAYLRQRGWRITCDSPDYVWRWGKDFDGKTIRVNRDDALSIQREEDENE